MMRPRILVLVAVASLIVAAPSPLRAQGRHGHSRGDVHGSRHFEGRPHPGLRHHRRFPAVVVPSILGLPVDVTSTTLYAPPGSVYAPPPVYAPTPVYAPAPAYGVPMQRVIEFATGRYELRGDGVYAPYAWVWIPNPPAAPPEPAPALAPPPAPTLEPQPRPAAGRTRVYRWTDEHGVTTWTDSLEKVPARHRAQASQLTP